MGTQLAPGVRVRFAPRTIARINPPLLMMIGMAGTIRGRARDPRYDWDLDMDEGLFDLEAKSEALIPIADADDDCTRDDVVGAPLEAERA